MFEQLSAFHEAILGWYALYGRRELIWRNLSDDVERGYKVYVSEVMLQQTQVNVVQQRFYAPFLEKFPTLESLAKADEEKVLKAWQGLGYYTRARNLHRSAKICLKQYNAKLPQTFEELKSLPGIGDYTAGAILCFGFLKPVSFVDGNIRRLFSRLFALEQPSLRNLNDIAKNLLCLHSSFDYNQALLDLGATLCISKNPQCLICPLLCYCEGKNNPLIYPTPKKTALEPKALFLGVLIVEDFIYLQKSNTKLYYGLYNLLNLEESPYLNLFQHHHSFKHSYTKYILQVHIYILEISDKNQIPQEIMQGLNNENFFNRTCLKELPLSALTFKALAKIFPNTI
uniref:A/G-specific adenine glycosylase n=1 Tax=Helicobacter sp. 15-1451 TaxID=2004995 RepID=UPI0015EBF584|nr:A/G-specific adenine glycosylase [Helicobacter sp. 15-1451]